ncbi:hypothetical protein T492DRAFT_548828 [Pavlovales sp. CCMP2436]|nr:hypothetical protein T492DRAFT_548828 [Pavlovales sp. CCMP2436]
MGGLYTRHLLPAVLVVCLALGLNAAPLADGGGTVAAGHAHATLDGTAPAREAITPHGSSHAQPVHAPASEHAPTHISAGVHAHALAHAPEHAPAHAPADEYENAPVAAHAPVHAAHRSAAEVDAELAERAIEDALLDEMVRKTPLPALSCLLAQHVCFTFFHNSSFNVPRLAARRRTGMTREGQRIGRLMCYPTLRVVSLRHDRFTGLSTW